MTTPAFNVADLLALELAVEAWRTSKCSLRPGTFGLCDSQTCDGENHQEQCDVEKARQDLIATHNKLRPR